MEHLDVGPKQNERSDDSEWFVGLLGAVVSIALAGVLEHVRSGFGATNIALVLALVVTIAAVLGRRRGALTTAVPAAMAYNFFQTEPIHTLRISAAKDVFTVILLLVIGATVGELSQRRRQANDDHRSVHAELNLLHGYAEGLRSMPSAGRAIADACSSVAQQLGAAGVVYEAGPVPSSPARVGIAHNGTMFGPHDSPVQRVLAGGLDLGGDAVTIEVSHGDLVHGHLVVSPRPGRAVSLDQRLGAIVLADQLALALTSMIDRVGEE